MPVGLGSSSIGSIIWPLMAKLACKLEISLHLLAPLLAAVPASAPFVLLFLDSCLICDFSSSSSSWQLFWPVVSDTGGGCLLDSLILPFLFQFKRRNLACSFLSLGRGWV